MIAEIGHEKLSLRYLMWYVNRSRGTEEQKEEPESLDAGRRVRRNSRASSGSESSITLDGFPTVFQQDDGVKGKHELRPSEATVISSTLGRGKFSRTVSGRFAPLSRLH